MLTWKTWPPMSTDLSWDCGAYGPEGRDHDALCFVAPVLGQRVCATEGDCADRLGAERKRILRRINELAAAGDETAIFLEGEFSSPDQLLGGSDDVD